MERELVDLAKLARPKDIIDQVRYFRTKYGNEAFAAKLSQTFGADGANELIDWLAKYKDDAPPVPEPPKIDDFAGITKWGGKDTSKWPVTVEISNVGFRGGNITWSEKQGRDGRWNELSSKGKTVNGETCLVIPSRSTAGHFDYLKKGQHDKILSNLSGDGALGGLPTKGERVGFYICTINRHAGAAKMQERSNVVWFTWP